MRSTRANSTRLTAALVLSAGLLAGCGDDQKVTAPAPLPSPTAVAPEPTATAPAASPAETQDTREWDTCVSVRGDLQVSYPGGWIAKDYPDGGCAYFDPEPFGVERGVEAPSVAVRLDVESVAYERVKSGYLRGDVIAQRDAEVAGYEAIRIEDRQTEGPLAPKGHRVTYLADLGSEKTLVLTTNETDAEDFAQAQEILDEMAGRLSLTR